MFVAYRVEVGQRVSGIVRSKFTAYRVENIFSFPVLQVYRFAGLQVCGFISEEFCPFAAYRVEVGLPDSSKRTSRPLKQWRFNIS
jgi:hypothetical protein